MKIWQLLLSISILLSTTSVAQVPSHAVSAPKQIPQEAQLLDMAGKLVSYGRQTKSALPLIQAVQIFQKMGVVDESDSTGLSNPYSTDMLLADATKFADGNKNLLTLIKETGKSTRGGAIKDPTRFFRAIEPGEVIYQHFYAEGGQYVQVIVDGQGEGLSIHDSNGNICMSDLKLTVFDKNSRVIASDNSMGVNCAVAFMSNTSNMTIAVRNAGQLPDNCIIYVYKTPMKH